MNPHLVSDVSHATRTFHVQYAGYVTSRLVVRLDGNGEPQEVMFLVGPCLPSVKRSVAEAALSCQLVSVALRAGTPLKDLAAATVRRLPLEIAVTRLYGQTPAPVANSLSEWVLRHLALTFLSEEDCTDIGVYGGFWCPACDQEEATRIDSSFFCGCGWRYLN